MTRKLTSAERYVANTCYKPKLRKTYQPGSQCDGESLSWYLVARSLPCRQRSCATIDTGVVVTSDPFFHRQRSRLGCSQCSPHDLTLARFRRCWRFDELWQQPDRCIPARRRLCAPHSQG